MRFLYSLLSFIVALLSPASAYAQTRTFNPTPANPEVVDGVATIKGLEAIFSNLVVVALGIGGITLFIVLVYGGFKYLTAGGNQETVQSAQQTLTYAFIGFVILVAAFLILQLISKFTGIPGLGTFQVTQ